MKINCAAYLNVRDRGYQYFGDDDDGLKIRIQENAQKAAEREILINLYEFRDGKLLIGQSFFDSEAKDGDGRAGIVSSLLVSIELGDEYIADEDSHVVLNIKKEIKDVASELRRFGSEYWYHTYKKLVDINLFNLKKIIGYIYFNQKNDGDMKKVVKENTVNSIDSNILKKILLQLIEKITNLEAGDAKLNYKLNALILCSLILCLMNFVLMLALVLKYWMLI